MKRGHKERKINQPSLFEHEEKQQELRRLCEGYFFMWNQIDFRKNEVKFTNEKTILPVLRLKGSLPILNQIKSEFFERLHPKPLRLYFLENVFQPEISRDWGILCQMIEAALDFAEFKFATRQNRLKIGRFDKLSSDEILKIFEPKFKKSEYLKILAVRQSSQFPIIPIIEFRNGTQEESFLFRFSTPTGRILICWENSHENRATYCFIAAISELEERLAKIESFIVDTADLKRSTFHTRDSYSKVIKRELMFIEQITHRSLSQYAVDLDFGISRY